jgi:hypothetical protein
VWIWGDRNEDEGKVACPAKEIMKQESKLSEKFRLDLDGVFLAETKSKPSHGDRTCG